MHQFTDTNGDFAAQTKFYIAFQIAFIVLRYLNLYVVGLFRRRNFATYGDVSVVYMYTHHVFFFTFYRVLFSSVTGVGEFVTILVLQVVADIALYIGLVMRPVHRLVRHAKLWVWSLLMRAGMYTVASFRSCCGSPSADATTAPFDEQFERELMRYYRERDDSDAREADLNEAIRGNSEDSLVRAIALVCTYASYVAVNMAIRFTPTIRAHYPESSDTDFAKLQVFLVIAMVVKLATTAAIEMYLRLQRVGNMGIWSKWSEFSANIEHLLVICAITVHITSDVFVPNVKMCFDIARCT